MIVEYQKVQYKKRKQDEYDVDDRDTIDNYVIIAKQTFEEKDQQKDEIERCQNKKESWYSAVCEQVANTH